MVLLPHLPFEIDGKRLLFEFSNPVPSQSGPERKDKKWGAVALLSGTPLNTVFVSTKPWGWVFPRKKQSWPSGVRPGGLGGGTTRGRGRGDLL